MNRDELMNIALDRILSRTSRAEQFAAFRCFVRGLQGLKPLPEDIALLGPEKLSA
jgi:hypothetical protein